MTPVIIAIVLAVVGIVLLVVGRKKGKEPVDGFTEIEQEMRYMKPTPIQDVVEVIDQLNVTSPGYRHYAELQGTSGTDSPIIGPYSNMEVAYYEVKCYQVTRTEGGGTSEKLVAHEKSVNPFFMKDGSGDHKVYVDMASFGDDIVLVNTVNHMEGPDSDFSRQARGLTSSSTAPYGVARCEAYQPERGRGLFGRFVSDFVGSALARIAPAFSFAPAMVPALAGADGGVVTGPNIMFAGPNRRRPAGGFGGSPFGGGGFGGGGFGGGFGGGYGKPPMGNMGGMGMGGNALGGLIIGATLASLLSQSTAGDSIRPDTFMGYRVVENVIPVNASVYTIGEIYKTGDRYTIGRATTESSQASYFSARPEEEVIAAMKKKKIQSNTNMGCGAALIVVGIFLCIFGLMGMGGGSYF
ncbi:MAG: GIDE domain-containing protein [Coriobacteriales bacterium]|jgi:hypothetical protein